MGATGTELPTREQVVAVKGRCRGDAGKVGVMFGEGPAPTAVEAESIVEALVRSALGLFALLLSFTTGAGPTLKASLEATAASIATPMKELIQALPGGDAAAVRRSVGTVWGALDGLDKTPLDNKSAIFKQITSVLVAMKDTIRELDELDEENKGAESGEVGDANAAEAAASGRAGQGLAAVEEEAGSGRGGGDANGGGHADANGAGANGGGGGAAATAVDGANGARANRGSGGDGGGGGAADGGGDEDCAVDPRLEDFADFGYDAGALGAGEARVAHAARRLLEASGKVLWGASKSLLVSEAGVLRVGGSRASTPGDGGSDGGGDVLDGWESVLWHARSMRRCCEDLGAAMYPPQDCEEVQSAAEGLRNSAAIMLEELPEGCAATMGGGAAEALEVELDGAFEALEAAIGAAEREE
ncbi:hypothetical protein FOA52_009045 [Chlamydomonas sp. UWO 241]|nr:hypothetical protein FOA52_009045 [Chlamydomonas sp. UWO 241]